MSAYYAAYVVLAEALRNDLTLPHGALLVAHQDEAIWRCAGLRYEEVPAFNNSPYADHWFVKTLI